MRHRLSFVYPRSELSFRATSPRLVLRLSCETFFGSYSFTGPVPRLAVDLERGVLTWKSFRLKDRIYYFVYGGFCIHAIRSIDVHDGHCVPTIGLKGCLSTTTQNEIHAFVPRPNTVSFASLCTCRQLYLEARNVLYSVNTFTVGCPKALGLFIRCLDISHHSLAVRDLRLTVNVDNRNEEREWDNTFQVLAENLENLRHIRIIVNERIWDRYYPVYRRHIPASGKGSFLRGLLELKKLPLKTIELVMTETYYSSSPSKYFWTNDQKREWAQSMKSAILGSV